MDDGKLEEIFLFHFMVFLMDKDKKIFKESETKRNIDQPTKLENLK